MIGLLSHLGVIQCSGKDSKTFLQGQLSCDLNKLTPGGNCLGAHCNLQGRAVSLFRLVHTAEENYFLVLPKTMVTIALDALKKYAIFSKIILCDASHEIFLIGGDELMPESMPLPDGRYLSFHQHLSALGDYSVEWHQQDIMQGIPAVYPETSGFFIPQRINLVELGAISLKKGCYIGQEILSRLYFKGTVKYKMFLEKIESAEKLTPGEPVFNQLEKTCGHIVDSIIIGNITYVLVEKLIEESSPLYIKGTLCLSLTHK